VHLRCLDAPAILSNMVTDGPLQFLPMRARLIGLSCVLVCTTARAQDSVHTFTGFGTGTPRCGQALTDTFDFVQELNGVEQRRGLSVVTTHKALDGNRCAIVQRYLVSGAPPGPHDFDSTIVDAATLRPIAYASEINRVRLRADFSYLVDSRSSRFVLQADSAQASRTDTVIVPNGVFIASAEALHATMLPVAVGRLITYDLLNPPRRVTRIAVRVVGRDTLSVRGERIPAWRLSSQAGAQATTTPAVSAAPDRTSWWATALAPPARRANSAAAGERLGSGWLRRRLP
jgi:hypothetical protein